MIKKLCILFFFLSTQPFSAVAASNIPPLPPLDNHIEQTAIFMVEKELPENEVMQLIKKYPDIQLSNLYKYAIKGFSAKGPAKSLEMLAKEKPIEKFSFVTQYQTAQPYYQTVPPQNEMHESQIQTANPQNETHGSQTQTADPQNKTFESQYKTANLQYETTESKNQTVTPPYQALEPQNQTAAPQYQPSSLFQQGDNINIIGGDQIRGLYDQHNNRLTGKGIKIGVIDTGIDYQHEDLRKNYGGGRDVVDQDSDPMETKEINGLNTFHGTHVAGIIAANGRMTGIAPDATIIAYRALGPGGMGTTEQVIAAIDQAIKDKVDVLNLSLGNNVNGPDLPLSIALNNAVDHGITAVTSSGNSGPNDWTVGSPGTASKAIAVGASTPTMKIPYIKTGGEQFRLQPLQGSAAWELDRSREIITGGIGKKNQLKQVKGKVVLIKRGELTFSEKVQNAQQAGAIAVIIYNNTKGAFVGNLLQTSTIPVMSIAKNEGETLKGLIEKGRTLIETNIIEEKDLLADFSSRGPVTTTWEIKPDILAPGVAINSTIPGGYLLLDGTSMAAPHVAGACALIKQAHPDWTPEKVKAALMNYAKPLQNRNGEYYKTYEQGAGRIQLKDSIEAEALVYPASLKFGKYELSDRTHEHEAKITIENTSANAKEVAFEIPKLQDGINWYLPMRCKLKTGEKREFIMKISVDPKVIKEKIQDGNLRIKIGGKKIRVPYIFVLEEPDYPRVMGFDFGAADKEGIFRYEVYLPGGAEEFGIALFDPDTYQFIQFLDWKRNTGKGLIQQELTVEQLPMDGVYVAKVFARKAGKEDWIETNLQIETNRR